MALCGSDLVSIIPLSTRDIMGLIEDAEELRRALRVYGSLSLARGRIMATVFLEPSTRTKLSFTFAMKRLGGDVVDFDASRSSLLKGETDRDTLRIIDGYGPDIIVLRQSKPGFPMEIKDEIEAPIINAGDGWNEHPTQALLDAYTIWRRLGRLSDLRVGIMGDLRYGRTPSSLSYLLAKFPGNTIYYIAPPELSVRPEIREKVAGKAEIIETESLEDVIEELDILYVTRLQKERLPDPSIYERLKGIYRVDAALLRRHRHIPLIMHPLPRTWELDPSVDEFPQAIYFEQARNGLYMRMSIVKNILCL